MDYSNKNDLIAFGGVQGKIGILDKETMKFLGSYDAHRDQVKAIYFNDPEC